MAMRNAMAFLFLFFLLGLASFAQSTVSTTEGVVTFFSSAPLEDILATNDRVRAVMNTSTGEILIRMRMDEFNFRKALMQRHFNEDYMESHRYPEAQFSGSIPGFEKDALSAVPRMVYVEGEMTIHGVSRNIREKGTIRKEGGVIICEAVFTIGVADYDVKIPRLLTRNIAEEVEVTIRLELRE
jgi:hypothetical protein